MKKLVFGLIATVMFGFVGNAQKVTKEEVRLKLATSLSELVDDCRPIYRKGASYDDFIKDLLNTTGPTYPIPTEEGQILMKSVHNYLSKGTKSSDIIKTNSGVEMAAIAKIAGESKSTYDVAVKVFGSKIVDNTDFGKNIVSSERMACCKWLGAVFNWIWDNHNEILTILCMFIPC